MTQETTEDDQGARETRRGIPADYAGDNPDLCNAKTKSGKPCRALGLRSGRCKWHGGLSTGPRTKKGRDAIARSNVLRARQRIMDSTREWFEKRGRKDLLIPKG